MKGGREKVTEGEEGKVSNSTVMSNQPQNKTKKTPPLSEQVNLNVKQLFSKQKGIIYEQVLNPLNLQSKCVPIRLLGY